MAQQPKYDWEAIKKEYRTGTYSDAELSRRHGCSRKAIQKKVARDGWTRDLSKGVRQSVEAKLIHIDAGVAAKVAGSNADDKRSDEEATELAAQTRAKVVECHRADIKNGREIIALLSSQLLDAANCRERLEDMIIAETTMGEDGKVDTKRRGALMKAVSIPAHAGTIRDLSTALKNLIGLERQAFNIDEKEGNPEDEIEGVKVIFVRPKERPADQC